MDYTTEIFRAVITILVTVILFLAAEIRKKVDRSHNRQKIMTVILLEMARRDEALRERLSPEFAKLIEMNGD